MAFLAYHKELLPNIVSKTMNNILMLHIRKNDGIVTNGPIFGSFYAWFEFISESEEKGPVG